MVILDISQIYGFVAVQVPTNTVQVLICNYRYSNGLLFCVHWFIRGDKQIYIQDRHIVSAGGLTVRVAGLLV